MNKKISACLRASRSAERKLRQVIMREQKRCKHSVVYEGRIYGPMRSRICEDCGLEEWAYSFYEGAPVALPFIEDPIGPARNMEIQYGQKSQLAKSPVFEVMDIVGKRIERRE